MRYCLFLFPPIYTALSFLLLVLLLLIVSYHLHSEVQSATVSSRVLRSDQRSSSDRAQQEETDCGERRVRKGRGRKQGGLFRLDGERHIAVDVGSDSVRRDGGAGVYARVGRVGSWSRSRCRRRGRCRGRCDDQSGRRRRRRSYDDDDGASSSETIRVHGVEIA